MATSRPSSRRRGADASQRRVVGLVRAVREIQAEESVPAAINASSTASVSLAGPRVETIFVCRIDLQIHQVTGTRGLNHKEHKEKRRMQGSRLWLISLNRSDCD